jgi:magnesium chelatase family protein
LKAYSFRINDSSRIRTNGKKATPLSRCGWAGDPSGRCRCHPEAIQRCRGKISGPLLERIDLHVEVPRLPPAELRPDAPPGESSDVVCARVIRAREVQQHRAGRCNAHLDQSETNAVCRLASDGQAMLENAIDLLQLSARSMHCILRVARTIADLAGSVDILGPHVAEATGYRRGERAVPSRVA